MSFVDLMANDIWSDTDINNKVQALIRSQYSEQDELKASRLARNSDISANDLLFIANLDAWISSCVNEGRNARSDMQLLLQVISLEQAQARLSQPEVQPELDEEGNVLNQQQLDEDKQAREQAQAVLDGATADTWALYLQRNPVVEVVEEPEEAEVIEDITEVETVIEAA
jgi:outer membrane protein assembly factor BamA